MLKSLSTPRIGCFVSNSERGGEAVYAVHGSPWWQQEDSRWMRPAAANLAQLRVAIPSGGTTALRL
jgi:hypothetical protein